MLNNQQTIDSLSLEQKLNIIANVSALGDLSVDGQQTPFFKEVDLSIPTSWKSYPSFPALSRSFNVELMTSVTENLMDALKANNVNVVTLPSANVKITPYAKGLSEDSFLSGELVSTIIKAGKKKGFCTIANDPLLTDEDVKFSDKKPNDSVIKNYFFSPFRKLRKHGVNAVVTKGKEIDERYDGYNKHLIEEIKSSGLQLIHDATEDTDTEKHIVKAGTFFKGLSVDDLKHLHDKYLKLMDSFNAGEVTLSEINTICENGGALSDEDIDETVNKILEFTAQCVRVTNENANVGLNGKLVRAAMIESTVLLKNDKLLPLAKNFKIAVMGGLFEGEDGSFVTALKKTADSRTKNYIGFTEGYLQSPILSADTIKKAGQLATQADVIIVGLGYGRGEQQSCRNTKLPAQQEALLQYLSQFNAKVIGVLFGDNEFDMSIDRFCDAIIMAPANNAISNSVLVDVIYGRVNPGGKLVNTAYSNTEQHFRDIYNYKESDRNLVGCFYGYRNYDGAGIKEKYPLGFGLGYCNFQFSKLKINGTTLSLTVKNKGSLEAFETIQLFVSKPDSALLRPVKELKAVKKVRMLPKQEIRVTFNMKELDLYVYAEGKDKAIIESGVYTFYVGTNINDIRSKASCVLGGEKLKKPQVAYKPSDYFQTYGNILDGKYYLEESLSSLGKKGKMKVATAFACIMSILLMVYGYLDYINYFPSLIPLYASLAAAILIPALALLIIKVKRKKKIKSNLEKSRKMKENKLKELDKSQISEEIPYEELFVEEFALPTINIKEDEETKVVEEEEKQYEFDKEYTFETAMTIFAELCAKNKVHIEHESMRSIFAGLSSSKLVILDSEDSRVLDTVISSMGKLFGWSVITEDFGEVALTGGDVLHYKNSEQGDALTKVADSLFNHEGAENSIRIMNVKNVETQKLREYIAHVFRYIDQPNKEIKISTMTSLGELTMVMPDNVWFVLTLKKDEKFVDVPRYILDDLCYIDVKARVEDEESKKPKKGTKAGKATKAKKNEELDATVTEEPIDNGVDGVVAEETITEEITAVDASEVVLGEQGVEEPNATETQEEVCIMSKHQFERMVLNAARNHQLDETMWKRLDKIEENVNKAVPSYHISSKQWQKIEKFASVYLCAGGEPEETLDSVVSTQIVCGMLASLNDGEKKLDDKFVNVVENVFGEGHAPRTVKKIKTSGIKI